MRARVTTPGLVAADQAPKRSHDIETRLAVESSLNQVGAPIGGEKGPTVTAKNYPNLAAPPLPADVADVALIAADTCAAIGAMSISWWHDQVRSGRAPKPVIQQPRCTRWKWVDVCRYWTERASEAAADTGAGARAANKAKQASLKAREPAAVAKALATRAARIAARAEAAK